jgi:hypothetical protein
MQIRQGTRRTTYDNRSAVETGGSEDSNPRRMMVEFAFTALRWCETAVFSASDICRLKQQQSSTLEMLCVLEKSE